MNKSQEKSLPAEIWDELRMVLYGRGKILDSLVPPAFFLLLNGTLGFSYALWAALISAVLIGAARIMKRQPFVYALSGVGAVLAARLFAQFLGREVGFFVPGLVTGSLTAGICLLSLIAKRPLAAWSSALTRRWPLAWYWHPQQVRPAYRMVFFSLRLLIQFLLFSQNETQALGWVQLLTGWPALIVVLIGSYIYGVWRLGNLEGPSVEVFNAGTPPPWESQQKGF